MNNVIMNNNNAKTVEEEDSKSKHNTFTSNKNNNSDFSITHVVAASENNTPLVNSTNNITNAKEENPLTCQDLLNVLQGNDNKQEEEKHSIKVNESDNLEYDTEELNKARNEANQDKGEQFSLNQDDDDDEDDE